MTEDRGLRTEGSAAQAYNLRVGHRALAAERKAQTKLNKRRKPRKPTPALMRFVKGDRVTCTSEGPWLNCRGVVVAQWATWYICNGCTREVDAAAGTTRRAKPKACPHCDSGAAIIQVNGQGCYWVRVDDVELVGLYGGRLALLPEGGGQMTEERSL